MTPEQIAELGSAATAAATAAQNAGGTDEALNKAAADAQKAFDDAAPSHDPVKKELNRVQKPKTEAEKARANLFFNAQRARELGLDPEEIIGVKKEPKAVEPVDGEVPDWYKKVQAENAGKDAMTLAEEIPDAHERELVKHALSTSITSGSPEERIRIAKGYVNSVRNAQIAEETARGGGARRFSSAPGATATAGKAPLTDLTESEKSALQFKGLNGKPLLTEDDIRKSREVAAQ